MKRIFHTLLLATVFSCASVPEPVSCLDEEASIWPDYKGVTVPENIAPLNFSFTGDGEDAVLEVNGSLVKQDGGLFCFGKRRWRKWMESDTLTCSVRVLRDGQWLRLKPFHIYVSRDRMDPYVSYRLIPPGYQGWDRMGIYERHIESYAQDAIIDNRLSGGNCLNCHSFPENNPDKFVFHARADFGGTFLVDGDQVEKLNTKTDSTISALVYPYWHPGGKLIAFSTNRTFQAFYNHGDNRIEVYDEASDIVLYDTESHGISWSKLTKSADAFETFPAFSPDGKYLYFCSARAVDMPQKYNEVRYALKRIAFDAGTKSFGDSLETVFDAPAMGKSVSFPRVSPDGRYLCFTLHDYGNFSIWHQEADLWLLDLETGDARPMERLNSDSVESFHTWSSNGRWLVFSTRRDDKLHTRLYFSHIDADGRESKPFLLPQKDPAKFYGDLLMSYNLPQFTTGKVKAGRRGIIKEMRQSKGTDIKPEI